jgi:hypothetical protein
LLSLPRVISHRLRRSRMTVTRNRFSCSSCKQQQTQQAAEEHVTCKDEELRTLAALSCYQGDVWSCFCCCFCARLVSHRSLGPSYPWQDHWHMFNKVTQVYCSFSTQTRHSILVGAHGCATNNMNADSVTTSRPVCTCPAWPTSQDQPNSLACCH